MRAQGWKRGPGRLDRARVAGELVADGASDRGYHDGMVSRLVGAFFLLAVAVDVILIWWEGKSVKKDEPRHFT